MSTKQIHSFFYKESNYYREKIVPLTKLELIDLKSINGEYYAMITQKGIDFFQKYLNVPIEIYNAETGKIEKQLLRQKDVRIEDKYVNHQLALNDFVLSFKERYGQEIDYYDEKYLSGMKIIRPDGLIKVGGTDLLLEQDMGTESSKQLSDKWNKYSRFLSTSFDNTRRMIVVFIVKCQNPEGRKSLVRKTVLDCFSRMNCAKFDIYVGTKEEMLDACFNRIIPGDKERTQDLAKMLSPHGFKISDGSKLRAKLGTVYRYYAGNYDKKNRLTFYNPNRKKTGHYVEFLADNYDYAPLSILTKVYFHEKNAHVFDIAYSPISNLRLISYVIIVKDIHEIYNHLKECDLLGKRRVFVTTKERLKKYKLPKALLAFGNSGKLFSCSDYYFEPVVLEGEINDFNSSGIKKGC